jgi:ABC-type phosphate/phosphonate transport system substrate-binding protein
MSIANLPWYDFAELTAATDAFWLALAQAMRRHGIADAPLALDRATNHVEQWRRADLLFSQACGYDVLHDQAGELAVVATPVYRVAGCPAATYRSALVVRDDDAAQDVEALRGRACVINEASSHSGTNALRPLVAPHARAGRFFSSVRASGDHVTSLEMVADRRADVACVDVVVLALCERVRRDALAGTRILAYTEPAPAPPFVTSRRTPRETMTRMRAALSDAFADRTLAPTRDALLLDGIEIGDEDRFEALRRFEEPALAHGYFELPAPAASPLSHEAARHGPARAAAARAGCNVR